MGFNRRKMEDRRRDAAEKEAATRRATDAQVLEDAERLIAAWNERQAIGAPMIFSPTIGATVRARYWWLSVRCPACRTINAIDLRLLDRHHDAAVSNLIPALSCAPVGHYRGRASPMKRARSIVGEYFANDCDRPGRREAALRHWGIIQVRARALAAFAHLETTFDTFRKSFCRQRGDMWCFDSASS